MKACTPGELGTPQSLSKQLSGPSFFPIQVESLDSESIAVLSSEQETTQND